MKGRGIPIVGTMPKDIPTLIKKCVKISPAIPYEKILRNLFVCFSAWKITLKISKQKRKIRKKLPKNPHSSPIVLNI